MAGDEGAAGAPVVVVGAGLAGLAAATALRGAGVPVVVLEAASAPGGRMATDDLAGARLDHGAQFFTVRSEVFAAEVGRWLAEGRVREWARGFGVDDGHPRYAGTTGMRSVAAALAAGADVRTSAAVEAVTAAPGGGWFLRWPGGALGAAAVVLTPPAPVAAALLAAGGVALAPGTATALAAVAYEPTLAVLAVLDGPSAVPAPGGVQLDAGAFSWVGDNRAKGVSARPAVTLHASGAESAARWGDPDDEVLAALLDAGRPWLGGAGVVAARLVRWRHARPVRLHPERALVAVAGAAPVVVAGDGFGEARVEGAWLSGLTAAALVRGRRPTLAPPGA